MWVRTEPDRQENVGATVSCRQGTPTSDAIKAADSLFLALFDTVMESG
jgi:hypothetical protein